VQDGRAVDPPVQQGIEPTEKLWPGSALWRIASGQVNQTTWELREVSSHRAQCTTRVAEGDAGPFGQVSFIGRTVTGEETSRQPGQACIAIGSTASRNVAGWVTEPVADEDKPLLPADHRTADRQTPERGQEQDVDQCLSGDGHTGRRQGLPQLRPGPRAVTGKGSLDGGGTTIGLSR